MEARQLFLIIRRWAWILALGLIIGLIAGFVVSNLQAPVYAASTKLLVSNQLQGKTSDFAGLSNDQLVETYIELLNTDRLREAASKKIGVEIDPSQISVQRVAHTQIVEIRAESHDPEQAAQIANTIAVILIDENGATRAEQFAAQEATLSKQTDQMREKINTLQSQYEQASKENYQSQLSKVNEQLDAIQTELTSLQTDIANLDDRTVEGRAQLGQKQLRIEQLQASYKIYDEIHANLLILGKPSQVSNVEDDPRLQEMKATLSLYQDAYNQLASNLEATQLARLQQTPNAAQIEEASVPKKPVRPIPLVYSLLCGVVGLLLAAAPIFFISVYRDHLNLPETSVAGIPGKAKSRRNKNRFSNSLTEQQAGPDQFSHK